MTQGLSVSLPLVQSLFSAAKFHKVDLEKVFKNIGLDSSLLDNTESERNQFARLELIYVGPLLRSLWGEMQDEASGFLKQPFKLGMFSMMCHAIITSGNLRRGLLRSARFISLLGDDLAIELQESGDESRLIINYENPFNLDHIFFITSIFVIWIRLSCWLIDKPILLERIEFDFPKPDYSDEFSLMFPCRHVFSQKQNSVVFNKRLLSMPIMQDTESLSSFLHKAPESLLTQFRSDESLTAQIKRMLLHRHGMETALDNISFEMAAEELSMTTHTLRRHLKDEGNSFQEIKDSIRRDQAMVLLDKQTLSIQEIAEKLGFSESAAFSRAFKKWTGVTPGVFRLR